MNIRRYLGIAIGITLVVIAAGMALLTDAHGQIASETRTAKGNPDTPWFVSRVCAEEDSVNCSWDADVRGDGQGHSFTTLRIPGTKDGVCIFYWNRSYAKKHDQCYGVR